MNFFRLPLQRAACPQLLTKYYRCFMYLTAAINDVTNNEGSTKATNLNYKSIGAGQQTLNQIESQWLCDQVHDLLRTVGREVLFSI